MCSNRSVLDALIRQSLGKEPSRRAVGPGRVRSWPRHLTTTRIRALACAQRSRRFSTQDVDRNPDRFQTTIALGHQAHMIRDRSSAEPVRPLDPPAPKATSRCARSSDAALISCQRFDSNARSLRRDRKRRPTERVRPDREVRLATDWTASVTVIDEVRTRSSGEADRRRRTEMATDEARHEFHPCMKESVVEQLRVEGLVLDQ
jgi:hypothetical protein